MTIPGHRSEAANREPSKRYGGFRFRFPDVADHLAQDEEWIEVQLEGRWTRFRLHDYSRIYRVPGLYEAVVYDALECDSPRRLARLLESTLASSEEDFDPRVLDLGAGNGIVGEEMREIGASQVVGIDILPDAARAARRDRPGVYDSYAVEDLCEPTERFMTEVRERELNTLVTVAALGFGDIPPRAFANAYNAITTPGWVALTIKEDFLHTSDPSGFAGLVRHITDSGLARVSSSKRIRHRVSLAGEPLYYRGIVARKLAPVPAHMFEA